MSKTNNPLKGIERRNFLKILSLTGIGSLIYSRDTIGSIISPNTLSNIVVIKNDNAINKNLQKPDIDVVKTMVDDGIKSFSGIDDIGNAWKSIFPGITPDKVIGLKVNTLFGTRNTGTHPQIAQAVTDGLVQMDFDGIKFPENNIIIFDFHTNFLSTQGYNLNKTNVGVRCFPTSTYSTETYDIGGVSIKLSTVITSMIDYLVNIAYLKQHFLSGVSLCLKNHYGSIHNPEVSPLLHDTGRNGNPYISAISSLAPVKSKQKFCIIDAIYGVILNGPWGSPNCIPNKIIMGQDIVAVDCIGRDLLTSNGLSSLELAKTKHIDTAATSYSLGTNEPGNINTVNIDNTVTVISEQENNNTSSQLYQNFPNPFDYQTELKFYLKSPENVQINIYNYAGQLVDKPVNKKLNQGLHNLIWKSTGSSGQDLPSGIYLCELKTESYNGSIIMQKIK